MRRAVVLLLLSLLAMPAVPTRATARSPIPPMGGDDVVVIAVIDGGLNPYHWDYSAAHMPQAKDDDPRNDLPLTRPPHEWLKGFPSPKRFASYKSLPLSLSPKNATMPIEGLHLQDIPKWAKFKPGSTPKKLNYHWIPGTKVIGAIEFGGEGDPYGNTGAHGVGTTSVSVGNIHGTCPECLLVFIEYNGTDDAERAIKWAMNQPWIDVVSNSYGHAGVVPKIYHGPTVKNQLAATRRGQTIFFSAGNGIENAYTVPNPTYLSSQKGPDWLITVGAVSPGEKNHYGTPIGDGHHASYFGAGKTADVAGVGGQYPSAYTAQTVSQTGSSGFGGTSNAAPTLAGIYARALYLARLNFDGPSRVQRDGVIAVGGGFKCGSARPRCELRDGKLTAEELRYRLLHGAVHTQAGMTTYAEGVATPSIGEDDFLNEGHGTYFARESGKVRDWLKEFERLLAPLEGRRKAMKRPAGERRWMIVDSFCRQHIWGAWKGGYYIDGKTKLPGPDPTAPIRSLLEVTCPAMMPPP
jgi:Subtilase family